MRKAACVLMVGAVAVVAGQTGGCANVLPTIPVDVELGTGLGEFEVQAGVPTAKSTAVADFDTGGITLGRGSVELDPNVITVTPADTTGTKGTVNFQQTGTLEVTVRIASADQVDTVCDTGEQYGPFSVTLDENYVPIAVDPPTVTLSQNTVELLNGGAFSLCIEVVSPVTGTVTIARLTFNLGF